MVAGWVNDPQGETEMKADKTTEAAVKAALDRFIEGYVKRDLNQALSAIAPDPDVVLYGTGADEKRIGLAQIQAQMKRDWSQSEAASVTYDWLSISAAGPVAWAAADAAFHLRAQGQAFALPARGTFVFEKRGEKWLIVQAHFSFPAGGQDAGESFPA
jgi:ketosteroid isomerase-like protein